MCPNICEGFFVVAVVLNLLFQWKISTRINKRAGASNIES